jgi:16S rRNA (guanine1207-N2)-methyltransferase
MPSARLTHALTAGALVLPPDGAIAVFRPPAGTDLSALPKARVRVITGHRGDHDAFAAQGFATAVAPEGPYAAAVVMVPRARALAQALIAAAAAAVPARAPVAVDGARTDGIDSLLKALRGRATIAQALAKAHGRIAVFANPGPQAFADWAPPPPAGGPATAPGSFSADGLDPGSAALAAALPPRLPARVADLGAGWGALGPAILAREGVAELHLVEVEHAALEAARANLGHDRRAVFHWADATRWQPPAPLGAVVMNPPFHAGRPADPGLGRAFIAAAARMLAPAGVLYMVANRHLPYERALADAFREVADLAPPSGGYKLIRAAAPLRAPVAAHGHAPAPRRRRA